MLKRMNPPFDGPMRTPENWPPIGATSEAELPCPVCGEILGQVIAHRDRRGERLKTVGCTQCGLMRTDPLPTTDELRRFYESEYRRSYKGSECPSSKRIYRAALLAAGRLRRLKSHLPATSKVLDIGCASGEWLFMLKARGHSPIGVELDSAYGEFGRREYGVDIRTQSLDTLQSPEHAFDCITMFHVLEHIPDPIATLRGIHRWLTKDGRLIVEVPNINSVHQNPAKRFHHAHVLGFTERSLATAFQASGWECLELSLDRYERNILAIVRPQDTNATQDPGLNVRTAPPPTPLATSKAAMVRYYLRGATYLRWLERMSQFTVEFRIASNGQSPREVLHAVERKYR